MARLAILGGGFMGGALAEGLIDSGWSAQDIVVAEIREARRSSPGPSQGARTADARDAELRLERAVRCQAAGHPDRSSPASLPRSRRPSSRSRSAPASAPRCSSARSARFPSSAPCPTRRRRSARARPRSPAAASPRTITFAAALNILSTVGRVVVVEESQLDAVTAVSGTGPAYVFYLAEALIAAAQKEGLSKEQAYVLVYQTFVGASELLSHDPAGPAELRARVTSPGGTTQAAIEYLEQNGWRRSSSRRCTGRGSGRRSWAERRDEIAASARSRAGSSLLHRPRSPGRRNRELAQPRLVDLDACRLLDRQLPVADLERTIDDLGVELQEERELAGVIDAGERGERAARAVPIVVDACDPTINALAARVRQLEHLARLLVAGARRLEIQDVEGVEPELAAEVTQRKRRVVGDERQHPPRAAPRGRAPARSAAALPPTGRPALASRVSVTAAVSGSSVSLAST